MAKTYMAKESTSQQILAAIQNITGTGTSGAAVGASAVADVTNAHVTPVSKTSAALTWEDPVDDIVNGIKIVDWLGTKVVRKEGSVPQDVNDGVVVVDSNSFNLYKNTPFVDTKLSEGTQYYYRWFPYNVFHIHTLGTSQGVFMAYKDPTIYVTKTALGLYPTHMEESLIFYNYTDGEVTVKTSDSNIVATIVGDGPGKTLNVSAQYVVEGEYTVTLMQDGNGVFNGHGELIIPVTLTEDTNKIVSPMNVVSTDIAPELWQQIVNDGVATSFFNVGDTVPIELNGDVIEAKNNSTLRSFDHETYYAVILEFDHNKNVETNDKNSIHFLIGRKQDGRDVTFVGFPMNATVANGWVTSLMRSVTCPSFLECLPPKWQKIVAEITKYSAPPLNGDTAADNNTSSQASVDKIFLLAEFEIQGVRARAGKDEQNHQVQYDYYKNGNAKQRYKDDVPTTAVRWWTRSATSFGSSYRDFCYTETNGASGGGRGDGSAYNTNYGFTPCFAIVAES